MQSETGKNKLGAKIVQATKNNSSDVYDDDDDDETMSDPLFFGGRHISLSSIFFIGSYRFVNSSF